MTDGPSLTVRLNGDEHRVERGLSIAGLLRETGIDPAKVAVERNREIVPRSLLASTAVNDGDAFEIVHFVGGG